MDDRFLKIPAMPRYEGVLLDVCFALLHCLGSNRNITGGPKSRRPPLLSDDALSVLVPILEDIVGWDSFRIRGFFEAHGFMGL